MELKSNDLMPVARVELLEQDLELLLPISCHSDLSVVHAVCCTTQFDRDDTTVHTEGQ